jgi:hypothetical protein
LPELIDQAASLREKIAMQPWKPWITTQANGIQ